VFGEAVYRQECAKLAPGDLIALYTDGVTEAANPSGEEFGEERLAALVRSMRDQPADEIVNAIHTAVTEFTEGAPAADDITVVVARRV
jgi:phosphoserine phosphatase RsbU/P